MISVEPSVDLDPDEVRFFSKVNFLTESGCWDWTRPLDNGYGRFFLNRKSTLAHRASLHFANISIPQDLQVDHLCRNRSCVRPDHLEPVTIRVNVLRGEGITAKHAVAEFCLNGHEFTRENTYTAPKTGQRNCKICQRERVRAWRARQMEVAK